MDNKKPAMDILGVPVTPFSMAEAVAWLMARVEQELPTQVVTANAEIIMMAQQMPAYRALLQKTDLILADGAGTVWAGRTLGNQVPERVAGFDLFLELLKDGAHRGTKFFLFGAAPGIAEAAAAKARECRAWAPGTDISPKPMNRKSSGRSMKATPRCCLRPWELPNRNSGWKNTGMP